MTTKKEKTISPQELQQLVNSQAAPVIVDVRSKFEYKKGHIDGAVHLPFWAAAFWHKRIGASAQTPLIITCLHGPRAKMARYFLSRAGFQNMRLLDGHMVTWKKLNMPMTKKNESS